MIKSFTVTNYLGESIKLDMGRPEESGFLIVSVTGLGPPKATINTSELSTNDGALYNSARVDKRNIVFQLLFIDSAGESIEDIRNKTYKYFPIKKELKLTVETDSGVAYTTGYVEVNEPTIFSSREATQISIVCPDSYFHDAGLKNVTTFQGVDANFEFPFSNESLAEKLIVFGYIQNKTENTVLYEGDATIGVTIRIHALGTVDNVTIYNTRTREKMKIDTVKLATLTGSGIIARDDIIINTVKGSKSIILIRDGIETNILNCLDKNVDWFTLSKGDNIFAFTAESGVTNLQFKVEHQMIYEGV